MKDFDQALAVQRKHETALLAEPGVTGVCVKQADDGYMLEVSVDPDAEVPAAIAGRSDIDGLPLVVTKQRFELQ